MVDTGLLSYPVPVVNLHFHSDIASTRVACTLLVFRSSDSATTVIDTAYIQEEIQVCRRARPIVRTLLACLFYNAYLQGILCLPSLCHIYHFHTCLIHPCYWYSFVSLQCPRTCGLHLLVRQRICRIIRGTSHLRRQKAKGFQRPEQLMLHISRPLRR